MMWFADLRFMQLPLFPVVYVSTAIFAITVIAVPANCSVSSINNHNKTESLMCNTTQLGIRLRVGHY